MLPVITEECIDELETLLGLTFDLQRRTAIKDFDDVQACPGSGKTTLVAAKLILLAKKWDAGARGICVLSHTNVAKNEIISRLEKDENGRKLLKYPHFIGTIQEFVNRFLALPYCRSKGILVNQIDDDICCSVISSGISRRTKSYLERKRVNIAGLQLRYIDGELNKVIPAFPNVSPSESYRELLAAKNTLIERGLYFYREMFEFAKAYLDIESNALIAMRSRFPVVIIDEMQDTQGVQDVIINRIFDYEGSCLQRLGDTDQAVFSGGDDNDNSNSYNELNLAVIDTSHRFDSSIANLASRLSINSLTLRSIRQDGDGLPHTIYIVNDSTRTNVLSAFARLCANNLPVDNDYSIKAVGAVGKTNQNGLTVKHYYPDFEKVNSRKYFKPDRFIEYVREAQRISSCNSVGYKIIINGIGRFLKLIGYENVSTSKLKEIIKNDENYININQEIIALQSSALSDENEWNIGVSRLLSVLDLTDHRAKLSNFISYLPARENTLTGETVTTNTFTEEINGRDICIELDTIHAVKGETHSATLLLETKFHEYDVHQMLDYIIGIKSTKPTGVRKPKFMKQLYVAMTRPKHLIGIAIDQSRFPEAKRAAAIANGWNIVDLTEGEA